MRSAFETFRLGIVFADKREALAVGGKCNAGINIANHELGSAAEHRRTEEVTNGENCVLGLDEIDVISIRGKIDIGVKRSAGATTCVSLFVGTLRNHRLDFPASSNWLRIYLPSGEMAARADFPLFVTCEIVKFWKGGALLPARSE